MYHKLFMHRRPSRVWQHAVSVGLVLTFVVVGLRYKAQAAAGDLDPRFGGGGKITTDVNGSIDITYEIARQSDGKLVVAGTGGGTEVVPSVFGLARYNQDGTLDSNFGVGGRILTDFSNATNHVFDQALTVAIQSDGKIVAGGNTCTSQVCDFALARYDTNGRLDPSFGSGGKVTTRFDPFDTYAGAVAVAIQPDGKIIAAGERVLARYNSDGGLDTSFGNGGKIETFPENCYCGPVSAIALQPDGKIIATGGWQFGLARFNSNGSPDATFGNGGIVTTDFGNTSAVGGYAEAVVLQPDGKIVMSGSSTFYESIVDFMLARYNSDGSLDTTFGSAGIVITDFGSGYRYDGALALALQADGKVVAAGVTSGPQNYDQFALARYNGNGSPDAAFGSGGRLTTDFGGTGTTDLGNNGANANAVLLQRDGKIVAAGGACTTQGCDFALARYLTDVAPPVSNSIDDAQFFVSQQYLDFLSRQADAGGLGYWTDQIAQCATETRCIHERRIGVGAAFFIEQEFQDTGYYVYRFYKASFGRQPNYTEFTSDRSKVIGGSNLEVNKQAFADEWVQRPAFTQAYPNTMSNTEVVSKLFDSAGLTASIYDSHRQQEIVAMNAGRSRALVLRDVIELPDFKNTPDPSSSRYSELKQISQYNRAFVLMQYFGYLRRDVDQGGYDFWLDVVNNREPNNYRAMVCAFITSAEYQLRFGPEVTRTNQDCSQ